MQRTLILLNPCGREAGRHKLKNGLKTQKMHFLPVFELTLASLTVIWVEQNQCPLYHSILLTHGPIHEILAEIAQLLAKLKNSVFFESAILNLFFQEKKFFASSPWKLVTNHEFEWMGLNFNCYDGLQPKLRAGIINEHECTFNVNGILSYFSFVLLNDPHAFR